MLPDTPHFAQFQATHGMSTHGRSLVRVPTQIITPTPRAIGPLHQNAVNLTAEADTPNGEDRHDIKVLLDALHVRYPAFNYAQYEDQLREQDIHYIVVASRFDTNFYIDSVGMAPDAAQFFCHWVAGVLRRVPCTGGAGSLASDGPLGVRFVPCHINE